ncbi:MAG TPA: Fe-S cluster assembly protein SufD [Pyrinomonadaceae bacterium]|jgi:Fe-S cluster assembly protein SufD|nr:Fe-S cluster assembly protein SufD [Pyrinomonadaceae bacterium]
MVSQIVTDKSVYGAHFRAFQQSLSGSAAASTTTSSWLDRLRESAIGRFEQLGFPTTSMEEWKYTNVAPIAKTIFEPAPTADAPTRDAQALEPFLYAEARATRLVFVNGFYSRELSSLDALPEGAVAMNLADALGEGEYAEVVREQLARSADYNDNAFTALNTAFISNGAFLFIPKGVRVESPVHLLFLSDPRAEKPTVSFPRVLVVAGEGSEATVIESYAGAHDGASYLTNAVVEIVLKEGARLEYYKVQNESREAFHIATTAAALGRNSSFDSTTITMGARLARHDIFVRLDDEGAECWVDGLYIVGEGQHADTHSLIDHRRPHCTSHQLYKGILDGKSRAVFNGKVFVREGAQKTDAMQTNRNLLLSDEARVDTKPQLEIFADDVKCAHGATVGQLEEEELFYLVSRGLHPELARNLLTYGFAEEVISKIKIESIKAQLDEAVLNRLHARLEA